MRAENLVIKLQLDALAASEREARQKRYESAHPTVPDKACGKRPRRFTFNWNWIGS
jgi:hypothetical protein